MHVYDYIYLIFFGKSNRYSMNTLKYQVGPPLTAGRSALGRVCSTHGVAATDAMDHSTSTSTGYMRK